MTDAPSHLSSGIAKLADEWQANARKHTAAANEEDCEAGSEEWMLHAETARIYRRCADQLVTALARDVNLQAALKAAAAYIELLNATDGPDLMAEIRDARDRYEKAKEIAGACGAAQQPRTPAFDGMIANLIELDKQRTPGPWKKTHDSVTTGRGSLQKGEKVIPGALVARCDIDWSAFGVDMVKASKHARFIVALENAWPKLLAALSLPSTHLSPGAGE